MNKISKLVMGLLVGVMLLAVSAGVVAAAGGPPENRGGNRGNAGTGLIASGEMTDAQIAALTEFWLDEYNALRTYEAIMADFGDVQPFASIARAEEMHIQSLERAFERYSVEIPAIPGAVDVGFADMQDACAAAAQAEIDNAGLYEELQAQFSQPDLLRVFEQLSSASLDNHLPAFEACMDGDYVPAEDRGMLQSQYGWSNETAVRGNGNRGSGRFNGSGTRDMQQLQDTEDCTEDSFVQRRGR